MKCLACGAQPWYILKGHCHDCGYKVGDPLITTFPAAL
jgi:ribosomal protein L37E